MQKMQQSTSSSVDALQGVHDSVSELVQQVANEPSVGLYFVQQHVHKAVPGLLSVKVSILPPSLHLNILSI
jgi:hypothetical protein